MQDEILFTLCCPCCGTVAGKTFRGSRTFTRCSKCSVDLYYETTEYGATIKIMEAPKTLPKVPVIPA